MALSLGRAKLMPWSSHRCNCCNMMYHSPDQQNSLKRKTSDLNIVTCPTLDAGFGTMSCNTSATPVSCTYTCPSNQYFEINSTTLSSKYEVTCNASNAEWSHMSSSNPLGDLPPCSGRYKVVSGSKIRNKLKQAFAF